jgi:hypothetical protein
VKAVTYSEILEQFNFMSDVKKKNPVISIVFLFIVSNLKFCLMCMAGNTNTFSFCKEKGGTFLIHWGMGAEEVFAKIRQTNLIQGLSTPSLSTSGFSTLLLGITSQEFANKVFPGVLLIPTWQALCH